MEVIVQVKDRRINQTGTSFVRCSPFGGSGLVPPVSGYHDTNGFIHSFFFFHTTVGFSNKSRNLTRLGGGEGRGVLRFPSNE